MPTRLLVTQQLTTKALDIGVYLQLLPCITSTQSFSLYFISSFFFFVFVLRFVIFLLSHFDSLSLTPFSRVHPLTIYSFHCTPAGSRSPPPFLSPQKNAPSASSSSFLFWDSFHRQSPMSFLSGAAKRATQSRGGKEKERTISWCSVGTGQQNEFPPRFSTLLTTYTATKANKHIIE